MDLLITVYKMGNHGKPFFSPLAAAVMNFTNTLNALAKQAVLCHIAVQKFHPRNRYRRYLKEKREEEKREELRKSLANGAAAAGAPAAARMGPGPAALVAAADEEMGTAQSDHNFPVSSHLHTLF